MSDRINDSFRNTSLYDQLFTKGRKEGFLSENSDENEVKNYFKHLQEIGDLFGEVNRFIGDDLSESDLDDIWNIFAGGNPEEYSDMKSWWEDKPHQIAYRLLLRLTRVEFELNKIKSSS